MMEKNNKSESRIQQDIVRWFKNNYCLKHHSPRCVIQSVPNESKSKQETLVKLSMGMLPGASDLVVVIPGTVLFVEVKRPGEKPRENQRDYAETVVALGFRYEVVTSLEEFKQLLSLFINVLH